MKEKVFGFYPRQLQVEAGPIMVCTLPEMDKKIEDLKRYGAVVDEWIYSPLEKKIVFSSSERCNLPYPSRVFDLPKTHVLRHDTAVSDDHVDFHIWALSFFLGMRLSSLDFGFLDATPIKEGEVIDFILSRDDIKMLVTLAEDFWIKNNKKNK